MSGLIGKLTAALLAALLVAGCGGRGVGGVDLADTSDAVDASSGNAAGAVDTAGVVDVDRTIDASGAIDASDAVDANDGGGADAGPSDASPDRVVNTAPGGDTSTVADAENTGDSELGDVAAVGVGEADVPPAADTASPDTASPDTAPADTGPADTGPADTGPADTGPADSGPGQADAVPDVSDSGMTDAATTDAAATDAATTDAGTQDATSIADAALVDAPQPCVDPVVTTVIHLAVDGLQAKGIAALIAAGKAPNFKRLVTEGASTHDARCDFTHSVTLPNMTAMMTGLAVSAVAGKPATMFHGYVDNVSVAPGVTLHNAGNPALSYVRSIFDLAHDYGLRTALYSSKVKFALFEQSWDAKAGAADLVGVDNGKNKIDDKLMDADTAKLMNAFIAASTKQPYSYAFVHLWDPDQIGHLKGWGSPQWQVAVIHVDTQLGKLLNHIESHPKLAGHTVLLVTADHGGHLKNHSNQTHPDIYTIPFYLWGARIAKGKDLYGQLTNRTAPGATLPDYTAKAQPLRNGDSAAIAAMLLGLPTLPGALMVDAGLTLTSCKN